MLVRVAVPPQKLVNGGTLRLVVIDGFVETVDVSGVPERQRGVVPRAHRVADRRSVTSRSRRSSGVCCWPRTFPAQSLTSTLERGAQPGGTRLVLDAKQSLVTGSVGIDNDLPQSLRNFEWTSSLALNSALGLGEQAYVSGTSGYNLNDLFSGTSPIQVIGGGVLVPIGVDGFKINPEYTNSVTRPTPPFGTPQTTGYYQRFDLRASYPLLLTRAQAITVQGTYEWAEESLSPTASPPISISTAIALRGFKPEDRLRLPWAPRQIATAHLFARARRAQRRRCGGERRSAVATGLKPDLQQAWVQWPLHPVATARFPGRPDRVGADELRQAAVHRRADRRSTERSAASGYPIGTFTVDQGATARGELGHPFAHFGPGALSLSPYLFGEAGTGQIFQATFGQQSTIDAGSFGVGVRTGFDFAGAPPMARSASNSPADSPNVPGELQDYRCNFAVGLSF